MNSFTFPPIRKNQGLSWIFLTFFTNLMLLSAATIAQLAPTVTTNKSDYSPGEYVIVTGSNWEPGQVVKLTFTETPLLHPEEYLYATADLAGNIYNDEYLIDPHDLGQFFTLVATQQSSGLTATTTFTDGGGAYSIKWSAADPELNRAPYLPTYAKLTPGSLLCPTPSGGLGRAFNPLANAVAYASPATASNNDGVTSLAPKDMALCQVVPFFLEITVSGVTTPENGIITINPEWLAKTTSGGNFGFDPSYGIYCAFEDYGDPGTFDPLSNAKVDSYSATTLDVGGNNERISGTVQLSGLDNGDKIIVELWVVLKCTIPVGTTGNVQTSLASAHTGPTNTTGSNINIGNQTVPLLQVGSFFTATADIQVTKTASPVCIDQNLTYNIIVTNNSTTTIANGIVATDVLGANQTFVSASGSTFTQSGQTVTFSVGALSPLQSITLTVVATPTLSGSVTNSVSVTEISSDPVSSNNSATISTSVYPLPTCSITGGLSTIPSGTTTNWCAPAGMSSYSWTGPGSFTATTQCVDVSINGEYSVTITNSNGCISTCKRQLTVTGCTTTSHTTTITQCDGSYTWAGPLGNGQTYTSSISGVTFVSTNAAGCDHTETLNLTINNSTSHTTTVMQCGGSYTWAAPIGNGTTYTTSGTYTNVTKNAAGCDHTETLNLTINPLPSVTAIGGAFTKTCAVNVNGKTIGETPVSGHSYSWTPTTGLSNASIGNPVANPSVTTTYTVTKTNTTTKCSNTATVTVTVSSCDVYYTYTQGYYSGTGSSCTPIGGTKVGALALVQYALDNMDGIPGNSLGQLYLGKSGASFTMNYADASKLVAVLPGGGTAARLVANYTLPLPSTILKNGKINNVLLSQTITLSLNTNIAGNGLGSFKLQNGYLTTISGSGSSCPRTVAACPNATISSMKITTNTTLMNLLSGQTVNYLLTLASNALGGVLPSGVKYSDINNAVDVINRSFDGGRFFLGYYGGTSPQTCTSLQNSTPIQYANVAVRQAYVQISEQVNVTELSVTSYPNPFTDRVKFSVVSPVSGNASLDVYNVLGQKLQTVYQGYLFAGRSQIIDYVIPVSIRGNLIYTLKVGEHQVNGKLIQVK